MRNANKEGQFFVQHAVVASPEPSQVKELSILLPLSSQSNGKTMGHHLATESETTFMFLALRRFVRLILY